MQFYNEKIKQFISDKKVRTEGIKKTVSNRNDPHYVLYLEHIIFIQYKNHITNIRIKINTIIDKTFYCFQYEAFE